MKSLGKITLEMKLSGSDQQPIMIARDLPTSMTVFSIIRKALNYILIFLLFLIHKNILIDITIRWMKMDESI